MSHSHLTAETATRSDEHLAAAARDGSTEALSQLFERHVDALYRLAFRLAGTREDAEDVVQDVFLGLRTALQRYEERESLGSWLRRITARRALMQIRASGRLQAREAVASPEQPRHDEDERLTTLLALRDAVARLPESLRQVFVLGDVEGFSHAEIAELLGITVTASRARRYRAVALLQSELRTSR